jgi:hypothetical protein
MITLMKNIRWQLMIGKASSDRSFASAPLVRVPSWQVTTRESDPRGDRSIREKM